MGDGILDNFSGLKNQNHDLTYSLKKANYKVKNAACDGAKLSNVLKGNMIPKNSRPYSYSLTKDGKLDQFAILDQANLEQGKKCPVVVLSIGGNDIKKKALHFLLGADEFIKSVLTKEFISSYKELIEKILSVTPHLILTVMIPPCVVSAPYSLLKNKVLHVYDEWRKFIYSLGREYKVPVIDLSLTLDMDNSDHYGNNNTCVSNSTSEVFCKIICAVVENYDKEGIYFSKSCTGKISKKTNKK